MGSESYWQNYVGCPFYRSDDTARRITCEGVVEGSTITQSYRRKRDFTTQMRVFCCEHFRKCEVYRMLMEKYDT